MPTVSGSYSATVTYTNPNATASGANDAGPTGDTSGTLGMDISDCTGWRVIISADSGQTLSGAGTVQIWLWSAFLGRWVHNSQMDYAIGVAAGSFRDDVSPDFQATLGYGRVYAQVVGVTSSSGNITTSMEGGVLKP